MADVGVKANPHAPYTDGEPSLAYGPVALPQLLRERRRHRLQEGSRPRYMGLGRRQLRIQQALQRRHGVYGLSGDGSCVGGLHGQVCMHWFLGRRWRWDRRSHIGDCEISSAHQRD